MSLNIESVVSVEWSRIINREFSVPIADKLLPEIISQMELNTKQFNQNGYGRRFLSYVPVDKNISDSVFKQFGIYKYLEEPMFGNFIGNNFIDGANVHPHKDPAPVGYHHVRCNLALDMPDGGGYPILDGVVLPIKKGDLWICFASIEQHASTPMIGGQRIILSLGGLVESTSAELIYSEILNRGTNYV